MKKITIEEVKKAIWESEFTCDEDSVIYYLQVTDDGEVVNGSLKKADEQFDYHVAYERYVGEYDEYDKYKDYDENYRKEKYEEDLRKAIDDCEVDGNEIFEEAAKNLCDQVNKWFDEQEQGKACFKQLLDEVLK